MNEKGILKTIWKYQIPINNYYKIYMPVNAKILDVQFQEISPVMWVEFNNGEKNYVTREFTWVMTGSPFQEGRYIKTVQNTSGLVWHLYEVTH